VPCRAGPHGYHPGVSEARATVWEQDGRWVGRLDDSIVQVDAGDRDDCLRLLEEAAGVHDALVVEVMPSLAGVAEAAAIMGWDKRRVITYIRRGSFPRPFASLAAGRIWRRGDVEAYAAAWRERARGRAGSAARPRR
jgi:hypothetical protein